MRAIIFITIGLGLIVLYLGFTSLTRCVVEGTLVDTPTGARPIEELKVGDRVWSRALDGGIAPSTVAAIHPSQTFRYLRFTFADGQLLEVTASHPLATETGWTNAGVISTDQAVVGRFGNLDTAEIETVLSWRTVYDISVEPHSNFFANGVLVHNKSIAALQAQAIGDSRSVISAMQTYASANCGFFAGDLTDATRGDGTPIAIPGYPDNGPDFVGSDLGRPSPYVKYGYHRSYQAFGQPEEIPTECAPNSALAFCYTAHPIRKFVSGWSDNIPDRLAEVLGFEKYRSFVATDQGAIYVDPEGRDLTCIDGLFLSFHEIRNLAFASVTPEASASCGAGVHWLGFGHKMSIHFVRGLALLEGTVVRPMFQLETLSPMSLAWAKEVEP